MPCPLSRYSFQLEVGTWCKNVNYDLLDQVRISCRLIPIVCLCTFVSGPRLIFQSGPRHTPPWSLKRSKKVIKNIIYSGQYCYSFMDVNPDVSHTLLHWLLIHCLMCVCIGIVLIYCLEHRIIRIASTNIYSINNVGCQFDLYRTILMVLYNLIRTSSW